MKNHTKAPRALARVARLPPGSGGGGGEGVGNGRAAAASEAAAAAGVFWTAV